MHMLCEWEGIWKEAFVPIPSFTVEGKSENSASISGFRVGIGPDYLSQLVMYLFSLRWKVSPL